MLVLVRRDISLANGNNIINAGTQKIAKEVTKPVITIAKISCPSPIILIKALPKD